MYYKELANRSRYFKTDEHGVMKMCDVMEKLMQEGNEISFNEGCGEGHVKGITEGITEMTIKFVKNLLAGKDMSYEKIAKAADTTVDEVIRIAKESGLAY